MRRSPPTTGVPEQLRKLTQREREVLALVARGLTNDEIAATLVVSLATIKTHVNRILTKLGLRSRAQAVVTAYETGLIPPASGRPISRDVPEPAPRLARSMSWARAAGTVTAAAPATTAMRPLRK